MFTLTKEYLTDLFDLFYPNVCLACSRKLLKGENVICFRCESELPLTGHYNDPENNLMKRFAGRVQLQGAAALYTFRKGSPVQHLLHQLKYRGKKEVGERLGKILGNKLTHGETIIKNIDLIIPVPLHPKKLKSRGYNQCEPFGQSLSETLRVPFAPHALQRTRENISQTKKKRYDRWQNVAEIFAVTEPAALAGKHILLVDDVVTTGATAEACLQTILAVPGTKVSFAAIAHAAY